MPPNSEPHSQSQSHSQLQLSTLSNPLATIDQLTTSSSQLDGIPPDLEDSIRYAGAKLTQAAGILLRLPQEVVARAVVVFVRFWVGEGGGSFRGSGAKDISAASLYLCAKLSFHPVSPRSILTTYTYLLSAASPFKLPSPSPYTPLLPPDPSTYHLSDQTYLTTALPSLHASELLILRSCSFDTTISLPHPIALTYLQTLSALPSPPTTLSKRLAARTLAHLNAALFSPQLLYLTHQPASLAVAAVYLAAREVGVKLGGGEWWEIFDVGREELGFLVLGMMSLAGWVEEEERKWGSGRGKGDGDGDRETEGEPGRLFDLLDT